MDHLLFPLNEEELMSTPNLDNIASLYIPSLMQSSNSASGFLPLHIEKLISLSKIKLSFLATS